MSAGDLKMSIINSGDFVITRAFWFIIVVRPRLSWLLANRGGFLGGFYFPLFYFILFHFILFGDPKSNEVDVTLFFPRPIDSSLQVMGEFEDTIARTVITAFSTLPAKSKPKPRPDATEWVPLAGITLETGAGEMICVALA